MFTSSRGYHTTSTCSMLPLYCTAVKLLYCNTVQYERAVLHA